MFLFLQLAGAFIVILTCAITGICWGAKTTYRIEELEHIQRAMTMLQSDIDFLAMPLPDALEEPTVPPTSRQMKRLFSIRVPFTRTCPRLPESFSTFTGRSETTLPCSSELVPTEMTTAHA